MKKRILLAVVFGLVLTNCCFSEESIIYSDDFREGWRLSRHQNGKLFSEVKGQLLSKGFLHYNFDTPAQDAVIISKEVNIPLKKESIIRVSIVSDGLKQRLFLVLRDSSKESYFVDLGRLRSKGERTIPFSLEKFFTKPKVAENPKGEVWGGDKNRLFSPPLTEIILGIDNYPDRVNREGKIGLVKLEVLTNSSDNSQVKEEKPSSAKLSPPVNLPGEDNIQNIVSNPSFEEGELDKTPLSWQPHRGTLTKTEGGIDGKYCAKWVTNKGVSEALGAYISQCAEIPGGLKKGDIWFFSLKIRAEKRVKIALGMSDFPKVPIYAEPIHCILYPGDSWQTFLLPYQAESAANSLLKPHIYVYGAGIPIYIDDAKIYRAPKGTEFTPGGIKKFITDETIVPEKFEE